MMYATLKALREQEDEVIQKMRIAATRVPRVRRQTMVRLANQLVRAADAVDQKRAEMRAGRMAR